MIINESSKKNDFVEVNIVDPKKFISAMGGILDSGMNESYDEECMELFRKELENTLARNKMSTPPTVREVEKSNNKIKIPWFLVGTLMSKAHFYGLEKKNRNK